MKIKKRTGNAVFATAGLNSGFEAFVQFSSFGRVEIFGIFIPAIANTNRCAKVSAPLQLLHIGARIASADMQRFPLSRKPSHISGFVKFHFSFVTLLQQKAKLHKSARRCLSFHSRCGFEKNVTEYLRENSKQKNASE